MRLWSVHPRYFDRQALTACWREGLLAQAVLETPNSGYGRHPQLQRFRDQPHPAQSLSAYLTAIVDEAEHRGYHFDRTKIVADCATELVPLTTGQLHYEWAHLLAKLVRRSPDVAARWARIQMPEPHPLFRVIDGPIASWERPSS